MKSLIAFIKKEWMELVRSGRLMILAVVFILLGIMNPAIAKLTPWMMKMMAASLEETGLIISEVHVDALTSWTQFFKNIPIGLIVFVLIHSSIFTKEYQSQTLVLMLTKGLSRYKVIIAKYGMMALLWTFCYWLCCGITYGYNAYFWGNGVACNLFFTAAGWWLFGLWAATLIVLFSVRAHNNATVLIGTGGTVLAAYIIGIFPKAKDYSPAMLMNTASLLSGTEETALYCKAICITIILTVLCICISIPLMNKKRI